MSNDLGYAKYISVTTFRRNGDPVATPVWTVPVGDKIYVSTGALSGKVKRLRGNERATVALCDMAGKNVGPQHQATARVMSYTDKPEVRELMVRKYGVQQRLVELMDKARNHTKWPVGERVLIELTVQD
jgi:uncharacterized protein